jgi:transketolase N-terminal domain/subunit
MTKPDRLPAATVIAQTSAISAAVAHPSAKPVSRVEHDRMANAIRALAMDAVERAKSGHPGLPMGAADIATVLFTRFLKFDPADPAWADRDRFVLSAGHGSMLLYAVLYLLGYKAMTIEEIKRFRQLGSITPGHPEHGHTPGVETTTGPLGQGLANAVGMAVAERHLASIFGDDLIDHSTFVLVSDGDLMEGVSQEATALAGGRSRHSPGLGCHYRFGGKLRWHDWFRRQRAIQGPILPFRLDGGKSRRGGPK